MVCVGSFILWVLYSPQLNFRASSTTASSQPGPAARGTVVILQEICLLLTLHDLYLKVTFTYCCLYTRGWTEVWMHARTHKRILLLLEVDSFILPVTNKPSFGYGPQKLTSSIRCCSPVAPTGHVTRNSTTLSMSPKFPFAWSRFVHVSPLNHSHTFPCSKYLTPPNHRHSTLL